MTYDPKKHKNQKDTIRDDGSDDAGSSGGQTGNVEFHAFVGMGVEERDDLLSHDEKKRLLAAHDNTHEGRVKKQKELREERKLLKEGKRKRNDYQQGLAALQQSDYPAHPRLADKAQFSGTDKQNNPLPNENVANTNDENRNELENQYQLRHQPQQAPKFNPTPKTPGT